MVRIDLEVVKEWVTKIQSYFFPTLYTPTPGLTLIHLREIWDGFCNKVISDRFDQLNTFPTYFPHFWMWLLNTIAIMPKSEDKYVEKCSTAQSFIRTEMSTYRIGILIESTHLFGIISFRLSFIWSRSVFIMSKSKDQE